MDFKSDRTIDLRTQRHTSKTLAETLQAIEDHDREFARTGYRAMFPAWLLRGNGMQLDPDIPDRANIVLSECVPMEVWLDGKLWEGGD